MEKLFIENKKGGNKMTTSFREKLQKVAVVCLASLASIIVVIILAVIIFVYDLVGIARGYYIFLKAKITRK